MFRAFLNCAQTKTHRATVDESAHLTSHIECDFGYQKLAFLSEQVSGYCHQR